ncbi:MAG: GNAT family N-acetyltransferase [Hyphomicrobiales bacterium]
MTEDAHLVSIVQSLSDIDKDQWDACANPNGQPYNPFVSYDFLHALEQSGSAVADTGWLGQHMILKDADGQATGVMPCYLKNHSQGEYIFDHGWADAFERAGGRYYPKLQVSVPFTPVSGPRLLARPGPDAKEIRAVLASAAAERARSLGASSIHATFIEESEWDEFGEFGYLQRTDQQFHFVDEGYENFDGFLAALSSRKRKQLKKERREALSNHITIEWVTGADITEDHIDQFFEFYLDTGARKWGTPYLTREFFSLLIERMADKVLFIFARRHDDIIAGALNMIGSDTLYGRYWGCVEDHPYLHFEVCYYQAIDYALAHGLKRVEAGAQGGHKLVRGYIPIKTYSAHWIANPSFRDAIAHYLEQERKQVDFENEMLAERTPFKKDGGEERQKGISNDT